MQPDDQPDAKHRQEANGRLSHLGQRFFKLIEFDQDEELIMEIRKHPFGLVGVYGIGIFVAAAIMGVVLGATLLLRDNSLTDLAFLRTLIPVVGGFLALLTLIMTAIGAYLYQSNVIFVTSEKIAQVLYKNLIDRKISQLSIGDVQDVTVSQNGIFSRVFNYGTLVIETAGEQQNYTFTFVPNPYESSKTIVGAHERNLRQFGN